MAFYEDISSYYDLIFPVSKVKVDFLAKNINTGKKVLDIACGTGGYSIELANKGYELTAIDLDQEMINKLKEKESNINFMQGNMLNLKEKVSDKYDFAYCIGNSLVHLKNDKEIRKFLTDLKSLLNESGKFLIQIINFDRILSKNIDSLPTITDDSIGLSFKRIYDYNKAENIINFKTTLKVNDDKLENNIPLYPILSDKLTSLLKEAGFTKVELLGDFKGSEYDKDSSYPLVVIAS